VSKPRGSTSRGERPNPRAGSGYDDESVERSSTTCRGGPYDSVSRDACRPMAVASRGEGGCPSASCMTRAGAAPRGVDLGWPRSRASTWGMARGVPRWHGTRSPDQVRRYRRQRTPPVEDAGRRRAPQARSVEVAERFASSSRSVRPAAARATSASSALTDVAQATAGPPARIAVWRDEPRGPSAPVDSPGEGPGFGVRRRGSQRRPRAGAAVGRSTARTAPRPRPPRPRARDVSR
jgi:hypothetical protein